MSLHSFHKHSIDIICFSLSRWDAPISSPALALARELARQNRVFYIEHPFSVKDYWKERNSAPVKRRREALFAGKNIYTRPDNSPANLIGVTPPLVYPVNFLPEGIFYRYFLKRNDAILQKVLKRVIRENAIHDFIFINFSDPFFLRKLSSGIRPLKYVYQCMDDLSQVSYTRRHAARLEEEIIRHADITLCTSSELTRIKSLLSANVHFFPNAADTDLFAQALLKKYPRPADLRFWNKKIIGFTGSIEYRTDFELLRRIAMHHDDKILFLLGPVYGNEDIEAGLHQMANVFFGGARPLQELPAYLQYFDCCIIPYRKNQLTNSIYPLKINEYLAAGKPVVATDFSEDIRSFSEVSYISSDHNEFISNITKAISEDSDEMRQKRTKVAKKNSWTRRVDQFWQIVT